MLQRPQDIFANALQNPLIEWLLFSFGYSGIHHVYATLLTHFYCLWLMEKVEKYIHPCNIYQHNKFLS